jgi:antitoxin VapB
MNIYCVIDTGLTMVTTRAKLFKHGGSQAVRLPKECRFEGDEVRVTKVGDMVVLKPIEPSPRRIPWELIDSLTDEPFMPEGREDAPLPDVPPAFEE